jgi:hypothetical protein
VGLGGETRRLLNVGLAFDEESSLGFCRGGSNFDFWLSPLNLRFLGSTDTAFRSRSRDSYGEPCRSDASLALVKEASAD